MTRRAIAQVCLILTIVYTIGIISYTKGQGKESHVFRTVSGSGDSAKIEDLEFQFKKYLRTNPDSATFFAKQCLVLSQATGNREAAAKSIFNLATISKYHGNFTDALEQYHLAQTEFEKLGNIPEIANCLIDIALIYLNQNNEDKALKNLIQGEKLPGLPIACRSRIYSSMGKIYRIQKQYKKSIEYHMKSYKINRESDFQLGISANLNNLGNVYTDMKNYQLAYDQYSKALRIKRTIKDQKGISSTLNNIGLSLSGLHQHTEAIKSIQEALKTSTEINDRFNQTLSLTNLGFVYQQVHKYTEAINYASQGIALGKMIHSIESIKEGYRILAESFASNQQYEKAYFSHRLYKSYSDSLLNKEVRLRIAGMETAYEVDKKDKKLQLLNTQKEKQELQLKKNKAQRNLLIALVVLSIVFLAFFVISYHDKKKINEKLKQINLTKSRFFANISHEIRTPLTLILGSLESLNERIKNENNKNLIRTVFRNATRLLSLVNQLLDLSKLESGKLVLMVMEMNVTESVKGMCASYESLANKKKIRFITNFPEVDIDAWIDQDKFEKIIFNLLGNAFKFTPESGQIILNMEIVYPQKPNTHGRQIKIKVSDTGVGIEDEHLNRIFDWFYQANPSSTKRHEGTGLGLALSKELIEIHHGSITANSEPGKGSEFTVILPADKERFNRNEIVELANPMTNRNEPPAIDFKEDEDDVIQLHNSDKHPKILIVEDNSDMRTFINRSIIKSFDVMEASNGIAGYEKAISENPDLLITDLMMPGMDGIELCEKIKTNPVTSHIPIILLTALSIVKQRIIAYDTGADDYLTKPFNRDELNARIRNLINQRKQLRKQFLQNISFNVKSLSVTSSDQKFLKVLLSTIENQISNPDLNVDSLTSAANLSRSQLHRKLKAFTGLSATEFIRNIRIKRAAQMLNQYYGSVAGIAYAVGFNNLSYFSKCFQKQLGMLPKEYIENSHLKKTSEI